MARRPVRPEDLFVFVGAGASVSPPAGLPTFPAIRRSVAVQLGLGAYLTDRHGEGSAPVTGLNPEPFMLALARAGVDVTAWLRAVLGGGEPNAAHIALADLAASGARVWTVNFDELIERAAGGGRLPVVAWPADPPSPGLGPGSPGLLKPHGSLGGELIVNSEQVLAGLGEAWERRLRSDVAGRTVVFLGYSGHDLDFQPLWQELLADAPQVLWFELPDDPDRAFKLRLVGEPARDGRALFPPPSPPPSGARAGARPNPSFGFLEWCRAEGLHEADPAGAAALFDELDHAAFPPLPGAGPARPLARAAVQGLLGDISGVRRTYLGAIARGRQPRRAIRGLVESQLNNGGRRMATLLRATAVLPRAGRLGRVRSRLERKRLNVLAKVGDHEAVLRSTERLPADAVSTLLILRSASLRIARSLDEAVDVGEEALRRAAEVERHPVRAAHAAYQLALALVWAERIPEARRCLDERLGPLAAIAAVRWRAWADFVEGTLAVRAGDAGGATTALRRCDARFRAEDLADGQISALTALLAAHRLGRDLAAYDRTLEDLARLAGGGPGTPTWFYARGHRFTAEAIDLDRAERARVHGGHAPDAEALDEAEALYRGAAASPYPLHAALAHLGLAMVAVERDTDPAYLAELLGEARARGEAIGARLVVARADALRRAKPGSRPAEIFFC